MIYPDRKIAYRILCLSVFSSFIMSVLASAVNVSLPQIGTQYHMSAVMTGWVSTAYFLTSGSLLLSAGRFSDIVGRERIFSHGAAVLFLSSLVTPFVHTGWLFILLRAVQGSGAAFLFTVSAPMVTAAFSPQKRGRVLGVTIGAVYAGLSAGPLIGGIISQMAHWSVLFYFTAGAMALVWIFSLSLPRAKGHSQNERFDIPGSVLYISGIVAVMVGLSSIVNIKGIILSVAGMVLLVLFYRFEKKTPFPLIKFSVFIRNRMFVFSNLAAMIIYSATSSVVYFFSIYLQYAKKLSPSEAGLVIVGQPIAQALLSPVTGRMSDTIEPRKLASCGMGIIAIALAFLAYLSKESTPSYMFSIVLVCMGIGFALFSSPNTNAVFGSVEHRHLGIASSVISSMRIAGQVMSMVIAIILTRIYMDGKSISFETMSEFTRIQRIAFSICAFLCIAAIFTSLARGNAHGGTKSGANSSK